LQANKQGRMLDRPVGAKNSPAMLIENAASLSDRQRNGDLPAATQRHKAVCGGEG